jgi:hypothetical protein
VVLATGHGAILQVQKTTTRPQQRILNGKRETEGKYENGNGNDDKRTTPKQAASRRLTAVQQSLLYLELGDTISDGCSGPTTGNLAPCAVGIGGKAARD